VRGGGNPASGVRKPCALKSLPDGRQAGRVLRPWQGVGWFNEVIGNRFKMNSEKCVIASHATEMVGCEIR